MAHLALLHDADPARRDQFAAATRSLFAELPGTTTGAATAGPVTCLWVASPTAPIDLHLDGDRLALLIGYAVNDAGTWATGRELADAWLAEGGDPFGLFPLYHATFPSGAVAISSTPEAFPCHPEFRWAIDRPALASEPCRGGPSPSGRCFASRACRRHPPSRSKRHASESTANCSGPCAATAVAGRLRRALQGLMPGADPRRYERLFNVDRPRWREVRRAAESLRPLLHEHLDAVALARVLPPPDRRVGSRSPLQAGGPIRLLCGLAFVLDR